MYNDRLTAHLMGKKTCPKTHGYFTCPFYQPPKLELSRPVLLQKQQQCSATKCVLMVLSNVFSSQFVMDIACVSTSDKHLARLKPSESHFRFPTSFDHILRIKISKPSSYWCSRSLDHQNPLVSFCFY